MIQLNAHNDISRETKAFVAVYNRSLVKISSAESNAMQAFQGIGRPQIPLQVALVLINSNFSSKTAKQNFKVSCQRWYRTVFVGQALIIKGNNVSASLLQSDETTNNKGKVVKVVSEQVKAERDDARTEKKAEQETLIAESEVNRVAAETATNDKKLSEANEARAIKNIKNKEVENRALKLQIKEGQAREVELKKQVARLAKENSINVKDYKELIETIKTATSLKTLKSKVA